MAKATTNPKTTEAQTDWQRLNRSLEYRRNGSYVEIRFLASPENPAAYDTEKSRVVASSKGNQELAGIAADGLKIGFNAYYSLKNLRS